MMYDAEDSKEPDGAGQCPAKRASESRRQKFRQPFQRLRGLGQSPKVLPLTLPLKGRRAKEKGEAVRGSPPSVRPWHQPAPPTIPSSANPELRTGLPKRGGPKRCCKMPLTARPFPQSQQPWMGTLSLPTLVQCVRLSESCCVLRLGGRRGFLPLTNSGYRSGVLPLFGT